MYFREAKEARTKYYFENVYGFILVKCTACNGSGYYDHNGSPKCGCCGGTGKIREPGPKSIEYQLSKGE